jgi:uncharacterized protein (DUF1778 family)
MTKNDPILSVRITAEDKAALVELAQHKRTTISEIVLRGLKTSIKKGKELL